MTRLAWSQSVAVAALLGLSSHALADHSLIFADLFWPDASFGSIRKVDSEGQGLVDIVPGIGGGLTGIALDHNNGKIYWLDWTVPAVRRCNVDGTNPEDVVLARDLPPNALQFPSAIAVDPVGGKIYWGDQLSFQLWSANLDGSNPQLLRQTAFHRGIAVDTVNSKVYWSTSDTFEKGEILRCDLNGSNPEVVITSTNPQFKPAAIALDVAGGKVYWTDYVVDVVRRANLDGTNMINLYDVGANLNPRGIALDLEGGKVYFGQDIDFKLNLGSIIKMDLDGANPHTILSGSDGSVGLVHSIVLLPEPELCPADVDGNSAVDVDDLIAVILAWGPCADPENCPGDVNASGAVDVDDLIAVILGWGPCQ